MYKGRLCFCKICMHAVDHLGQEFYLQVPDAGKCMHAQERWARMEEKVMRPRRKERDAIRDPKIPYPVRYDYGSELFSVRRKEFWPLSRMSTLLDQFIPSLPHEADGLIFQVCLCPGTWHAGFDVSFTQTGRRVGFSTAPQGSRYQSQACDIDAELVGKIKRG